MAKQRERETSGDSYFEAEKSVVAQYEKIRRLYPLDPTALHVLKVTETLGGFKWTRRYPNLSLMQEIRKIIDKHRIREAQAN